MSLGWNSILQRLSMGRDLERNKEISLGASKVKELEDFYGVKVVSDGRGNVTILPAEASGLANSLLGKLGAGGSNSDYNGFLDYWLRAAYINPNDDIQVEQDRKIRYAHYAFMDNNSTEAGLTLDTYADELMSIGTLDENPIKISISDKKVQEQILEILKDNNIISTSERPTYERAEVRELGKYGDRFYKISKMTADSPLRIHKVRCPELVQSVYDPRTYKTLMWAAGQNGEVQYYPWEFSHTKIPDAKFAPYGRSILEPMRAAYQQLLINEALLAISRASKVDRLVIKVPTQGKNATTAFANLHALRRAIKVAVFGNSGEGASRAKLDAFTDVALIPSGEDYGLDRMTSSINVADVEDVNYFLDKYLAGSRLPKGYLMQDDTFKIDAGSLQAQDLKFARALLPLQYGYVEGLTRLIMVLMIILGHDVDKIKVKVSVKKPQAFSQQALKDAMDSISFMDSLIKSYEAAIAGPNTKFDKDRGAIHTLFKKMSGLPPDILELLKRAVIPVDTASASPTDPSAPGVGGGGAILDPQVPPPASLPGQIESREVYYDGIIEITGEMILAQLQLEAPAMKSVLFENSGSGARKTLSLNNEFLEVEHQYFNRYGRR